MCKSNEIVFYQAEIMCKFIYKPKPSLTMTPNSYRIKSMFNNKHKKIKKNKLHGLQVMCDWTMCIPFKRRHGQISINKTKISSKC